jgi:hypothetical protein
MSGLLQVQVSIPTYDKPSWKGDVWGNFVSCLLFAAPLKRTRQQALGSTTRNLRLFFLLFALSHGLFCLSPLSFSSATQPNLQCMGEEVALGETALCSISATDLSGKVLLFFLIAF